MERQLTIANALMHIISRLGTLVMWLAFIVFHEGLFLAAFFALWITETTPVQIIAAAKAAFHLLLAPTTGTILRLVGISSLVAVLGVYVWLWRRIFAWSTSRFLFRRLLDVLEQQG